MDISFLGNDNIGGGGDSRQREWHMRRHRGIREQFSVPGVAGAWGRTGNEDELGLAPVYKGPCVGKMLARDPRDEGKQDFKLGSVHEQMHFWHHGMVRGRSYGGSSGRDDVSLN